VDFSFSPEQETLAETVRQFLAAKAPEPEVRRAMDSELGYDPALWARMAGELGLQGLAIPEQYGGAGFSAVELGIVLQEMGRALVCAPFLSSVVFAAHILQFADDDAAAAQWLPRIVSGELVATVPLARGRQIRASRTDREWRLDGVAEFALDGAQAELLLVPADTIDGPALFAITGPADGLRRESLYFFDPTRRLARLSFAGCAARLIGEIGTTATAVEHADDVAAIALAAECVGVAERTLEMATDYAKIREQFGQPIGSFQAIKHKLANVLLEVEAARSAAWYALWCAANREEEIPIVAPLALATCAETAYLATAENIQVHGGIGYTWEHPAHLYFRRATVSRQLLGDPAELRERMLQLVHG
jgi:alkylation response protein AidB-like acyl-CoA dehydrogenase